MLHLEVKRGQRWPVGCSLGNADVARLCECDPWNSSFLNNPLCCHSLWYWKPSEWDSCQLIGQERKEQMEKIRKQLATSNLSASVANPWPLPRAPGLAKTSVFFFFFFSELNLCLSPTSVISWRWSNFFLLFISFQAKFWKVLAFRRGQSLIFAIHDVCHL